MLKFFNYTQYILLRTLYACYGLIPARKAYSLGFAVAVLCYPLFRKRRIIAVDNILRAGVTRDKTEAERIARHAFGHLAGHLCEALKISEVVNNENWRDHIVLDGPEESWQLLLRTPDKPVMILTGHHGVWEAAASILSFSRPMIAVARKMNNPYINRFMRERHFRGDVTLVPKNRGFTTNVIRDWLRRNAAMTLLMDQHAGRRHGIPVNFMGRTAYTYTSPARLHFMTGAPILVGSFIRESAFHYRMVTGTPICWSGEGDADQREQALLSEVNERLAELIRRFPEQYLWAHQRWR